MDKGQLAQLYRRFIEAGYDFRQFGPSPPGRILFLRHDIDFCLGAAAECAELEHGLGVTATYFLMLSTPFYNLHSPTGRRCLDRLRALGHRISLHFDPEAHEDIDAGFEAERAAFEALTGERLSFVSIHRPRAFLGRRLPGVEHSYEPAWFRDVAYMSDSCGAFRHGHPLGSEAFREGRPIHLLLHPVWWFNAGDCPSDKLAAWRDRHFAALDDAIAANCAVYRPADIAAE